MVRVAVVLNQNLGVLPQEVWSDLGLCSQGLLVPLGNAQVLVHNEPAKFRPAKPTREREEHAQIGLAWRSRSVHHQAKGAHGLSRTAHAQGLGRGCVPHQLRPARQRREVRLKRVLSPGCEPIRAAQLVGNERDVDLVKLGGKLHQRGTGLAHAHVLIDVMKVRLGERSREDVVADVRATPPLGDGIHHGIHWRARVAEVCRKRGALLEAQVATSVEPARVVKHVLPLRRHARRPPEVQRRLVPNHKPLRHASPSRRW